MSIKDNDYIYAKKVLAKSGISRTKFRTDLLILFFKKNNSLSIVDIMKYFDNLINRVTVYRALTSFENKGLIHKVPDNNNFKRYSLCNHEDCSTSYHNDKHGHFICSICSQTYCMEEIKIPFIKPIKGFTINDLSLTLKGFCKNCNI